MTPSELPELNNSKARKRSVFLLRSQFERGKKVLQSGYLVQAGSAALFFFVLLLCSASLMAEPQLTGHVVDEAQLLSPAESSELESLLAAHEKATTNQVVVLTLKSLDGQNIEEYGYQLGRKWALGVKGKNNGVLFIVAPTERAVRIEVGYGLEDILTDARSKIILSRDIVPSLRQGKMNEGIIQGTKAILNVLGGGEAGTNDDAQDLTDIWPVLLVFLIVGSIIFISNRLMGGGKGGRGGRSGPIFFGGGGGFSGGSGGFSGGGGSFGGGGASGRF